MSTDRRPVFVISIAAELAGMHPQTLRVYERRGLVNPGRTAGNARRYSQADVDLLRRIQTLSEEGLNLAGIERVLELEGLLTRAVARIEELERAIVDQERAARDERAALTRSMRADIVLVRRGGPPAVRVAPVMPPRGEVR